MPKTNFFQGLESLQIKGTIKIVLTLSADRIWTGSILVIDPELKDPAVKSLPPLRFTGTSEELGEGFFEALTSPMQKISGFLTSVREYEAQIAEADKAARMNQPTATGKASKTVVPTDRKFQEKMKKVDALEMSGKIGEAIGAMPKEAEFPNQSAAIKVKMEALKQKHGGFSLFETEEPQAAESATPMQEDAPEIEDIDEEEPAGDDEE